MAGGINYIIYPLQQWIYPQCCLMAIYVRSTAIIYNPHHAVPLSINLKRKMYYKQHEFDLFSKLMVEDMNRMWRNETHLSPAHAYNMKRLAGCSVCWSEPGSPCKELNESLHNSAMILLWLIRMWGNGADIVTICLTVMRYATRKLMKMKLLGLQLLLSSLIPSAEYKCTKSSTYLFWFPVQ